MVVGGRELIDTLWNVNKDHILRKIRELGINRYIMECKLIPLFFRAFAILELIDTLWNVN